MTVEDLSIDELNGTIEDVIKYLQDVKRNLNQIGVLNINVYLESGVDDDENPIVDFYIGYDK